MFATQRKAKILERLEEKKSVTVTMLAEDLGVSESTIRRDLEDLEEQGELKRTFGGAVLTEVSTFEPSLPEKVVHYPEEKSAIGRKALSLIESGDTILLDSGTTTLEIARNLPDMEITVVTNSLQIGQELSSYRNVKLLFLGGELRPTTGAFVGSLTESLLSQLNVDKLFLGTNAIDLEHGVTTPNTTEAATKRAMIHSAREVILTADHSKFGKISLVKVCDFADLDVILTDSDLPEEYAEVFEQNAVEMILSPAEQDGKEIVND
ncbi:MAG TPA: DeoR/GlpR family DNA-binding transcription regulator [Bacillales bacterium]|nr:DeoR/GlpR family DNA-binding transcription regulator [Bacillales bacterium]